MGSCCWRSWDLHLNNPTQRMEPSSLSFLPASRGFALLDSLLVGVATGRPSAHLSADDKLRGLEMFTQSQGLGSPSPTYCRLDGNGPEIFAPSSRRDLIDGSEKIHCDRNPLYANMPVPVGMSDHVATFDRGR